MARGPSILPALLAITWASCLQPPLQVARCQATSDCPARYTCGERRYCVPDLADGGLVVEDGGVDAGVVTPCASDAVCDDDDSCNGVETCDLATSRCQPATLPWPGFHDGERCGDGMQCLDGACVPRDTGCVSQLALGASHSCALMGDGTVRCWGRNHAGQLGTGSLLPQPAPTAVTGLAGVVAIAAGFDFSCALLDDGAVRCWGANGSGQLGNDSSAGSTSPVAVAGLAPAQGIVAGKFHACALLRDGAVYCWGDDENGQLGDGQAWTLSRIPVHVPLVFAPVALAAGGYHTCALDAAGGVWCWGARWSGQTGTNVTPSFELQPARVPSIGNVRRLAAGEGHTCAVREDQTLWCWGDDPLSLAGPDATDHATPRQVEDLSEVVDVDTSMYHVCARLQRGGVKCWGFNREGQLGDGSRSARDAPGTTLALADSDAVEVRAGGTHGCARTRQGSIWCWGDNTFGQIGEGPLQATPSVAGVLASGVQAIRAGLYHTCLLLQGGGVSCTGWNQRGQLGVAGLTYTATPQPVPSLDSVTALAVGPQHGCAVRAGKALCWGANEAGQLAIADHQDRATPQEVAGLINVAELALGWGHSCARSHAGQVWCWGRNDHGELGSAVNGGSNVPVLVTLTTAAAQISARIWTTCARLDDGTAWCWGYNRDGQVGAGDQGSDPGFDGRATPRQVTIAGGVVDIAAGGNHACAVDASGQIWCWGAGSLGALGTGDRASSAAPRPVVDLLSALDVELSWNNSCAIDVDGDLWCWGSNDAGELGNDFLVRDRPARVLNLGGVTQTTAAELHTCAVTQSGSGSGAFCWGQWAYGQLGNGNSATTLVPVEVTALRCP